MKVIMITGKLIPEFLPLLTNAEISGIESRRFTCFGAYDETSRRPMGILTAEVHLKTIQLIRFFTHPAYRRQGVARSLFAVIANYPKSIHASVYALTAASDDAREFLTALGLRGRDSHYSYVEGTPMDMIRSSTSVNKPPFTLCSANKVSAEELTKYVLRHPCDEYIQFPGGLYDMNRFSEASLVCLKNGKITGATLVEEWDDHIDVVWTHGNDFKMELYMLNILRKIVKREISPQILIRFLSCSDKESADLQCFFINYRESPIEIFELFDLRKKENH